MEVVDVIIKASQVLTALGIICGLMVAGVKWLIRQKEQDVDIKNTDEKISDVKKDLEDKIHEIQSEQTIICYGVLAALKGLKERGCNGPVTEAIDKMEKYLNIKAHK